MKGCVIAAFPATGKSRYAANAVDVVDSDSSAFSWGADGERHPDWPANYMAHIWQQLGAGKTVLVSTHAEVRNALFRAHVPYTLVYPMPALRDEYRARMARRGSPASLIDKVIDELWDDALQQCARTGACVHVVLRAGEYLSDVLVPQADNGADGRIVVSFDPEAA